MTEFYSWLIKIWLALTIVKTLMGYYQMPLMLRIMSKHLKRDLEKLEIIQLLIFSPLVNLFVVWHYVFKEKLEFFSLYDESYIEGKLKRL